MDKKELINEKQKELLAINNKINEGQSLALRGSL